MKQVRVLLVASGGGHWVQLLRLQAAWAGCDVAYATVQASYREQVPGARFYLLTDATRWDRWRLIKMVFEIAYVLVRERPEVIVTTGAAPGAVTLRLGCLLGARTVWIDSIANVEAVSLSGQRIGPHADLWLTQWKHLAAASDEQGPCYRGSVL